MEQKDVIGEENLKILLNCKRRGDLRRILDNANIPYIYGVGGSVATTVHAINCGLGVTMHITDNHDSEDNEELEFLLNEEKE